MAKTMKLADVIRELQSLHQEFGNLPVYMSGDSEGNHFGTLAKPSFTIPRHDSPEYVCLYPNEEYLLDNALTIQYIVISQ